MKKLVVIVFCTALLGFSYFGLDHRLYFAPTLINLSEPFLRLRIIVVATLVSYTFFSWIRLHLFKVLLFISGLSFISFGLVSIYSPGLFGHLNNWILLGDSLTAIEVGIIAIVLSSELSDRRSKYLAEIYYSLKLSTVKSFKYFKYVYSVVLMNLINLMREILIFIEFISGLIGREFWRTANIPSNVPP